MRSRFSQRIQTELEINLTERLQREVIAFTLAQKRMRVPSKDTHSHSVGAGANLPLPFYSERVSLSLFVLTSIFSEYRIDASKTKKRRLSFQSDASNFPECISMHADNFIPR